MTVDTNTDVTDNTSNTADSDVQADTSFLTTPITESEEGAEKPAADEVSADEAGKKEGESETDKPDGEKPEDDADKDKSEGVPEKYEFTAPEGVELDPEATAEFEPIARELGLTNAQAQKLVDLQAGLVRKQSEAWDTQVKNWVTEIKADKEIGGENIKETITLSQKAMTVFGTPELKAALDSTKMGNHPELVRAFVKIGKAMADDTFLSADKLAGEKKSAADRMYGKKT
tara:strand:+ start:444440 stop:445129 length:690 start_codon:yes stop_codon:yes gene_type:complete